jgi:flagellar protein FliS
MDHSARCYLEAEVMTATPQKLRLLLIDGALRFAHQTLNLWSENRNDDAIETLIRCRLILGELLSGIRVEESQLTRRVAGVYLFLLRCLAEAQLKHDVKRLQEMIKVLEFERETWRLVCEKMPEAPVASVQETSVVEIIASSQGIDGPDKSAFSFDA